MPFGGYDNKYKEWRMIQTEPRFAGIKKMNIKAAALPDRTGKLSTILDEAEEKLSGLKGRTVFCPDFAPADIAQEISKKGGLPVFIDASPDDWGMDPEALDTAFELYPETELVIFPDIYGSLGQMEEIARICAEHGALLAGDISACGEGENNRAVGAMVQIYEKYEEKLAPLDIWMNPELPHPCMMIEGNGLSEAKEDIHGKTTPAEIVEALETFGIKSDRLYEPVHLKPEYAENDFVSADGSRFEYEDGGLFPMTDESGYIYERGVILPAYPEMTEEEQDTVIEIIYACFNRRDMERLP